MLEQLLPAISGIGSSTPVQGDTSVRSRVAVTETGDDFGNMLARMATDTFEDAGIYVGTHTGQLFYSRDSGDSWDLMADFLPPIQSVEAAVI